MSELTAVSVEKNVVIVDDVCKWDGDSEQIILCEIWWVNRSQSHWNVTERD